VEFLVTWTKPIKANPYDEAVVLIPGPTARLQDLGFFRTGQEMETDILVGSAVVALRAEYDFAVEMDKKVRFAFEGNAIGAVNLRHFHERCACAAGRLLSGAPSIAYGEAFTFDLIPVATYDIGRKVFLDVFDDTAIHDWSGESMKALMPSISGLPCVDPDELRGVMKMPMSPVLMRPGEGMIWKMLDGSMIVISGNDPAALRDPEDPVVIDLLDRLNVDDTIRDMIHWKYAVVGDTGDPSP